MKVLIRWAKWKSRLDHLNNYSQMDETDQTALTAWGRKSDDLIVDLEGDISNVSREDART